MKKVIIENTSGEKLHGILDESSEKKGLVILCHGFSGNKETKILKELKDKIVEQGFDVFRFDFSGNGESEGVFGDSGLIKERQDLISVVKHFKDYKNIILGGFSLGGAVAVITSNYSKKIKATFVISGVVLPSISFKDSALEYHPSSLLSKLDNNKIVENLKKHEKHKHSKITKNLISKGEKFFKKLIKRAVLNKSFFEQLIKVDVTDYAERLKKPMLIIHGKKDSLIPLSHAEYLYHQNSKNKRLVILNIEHHLISSKETSLVSKEVINWLVKQKINGTKNFLK